MILGELIKFLEAEDPALVLPQGFANPHSYRGYYDELAFEPAVNVTVGGMLEAARSAVGATYQGWKGGDYRMGEYTECWLAIEGCTGEGIGPVLLRSMIGAAKGVAIVRPEPGAILSLTTDGLERVTAQLNEARNQLAAARRALERIADGDPGHVTIAVDALRASGAAQTCAGGC